MQTGIVRIGLVEDHTLFRQTLAAHLNTLENLTVVLEAGHGADLQTQLKSFPLPDLLFLDIAMPVMDGFATLEWLHQTYPALPVVILTDRETDLTLGRLIRHGARAVVKKSADVKTVQKTITRVLEEGYCFTDAAARRLLLALYRQEGKNGSRPALSEKEWTFLKLAATDLTYAQIAALMNTSLRCIDKLRNRLFEKLEIKNRTTLAVRAMENGIVKDHP